MPINKAHIYKSMIEELTNRCRFLNKYNDRCAKRLMRIKKIIRRRKSDTTMLKLRLDRYKDNWRAVSMKRQLAPHPKRKTEQKRGPKPKPKLPAEMNQSVNGDDLTRETYIAQQPHTDGFQFHQLQQHPDQSIDHDWPDLTDPEQHKTFANLQLPDNFIEERL